MDTQEKRRIVFARSDAKCIDSESYLQGSYKPDIILVKWDVFKRAHQCPRAAYSESYESHICCKSGKARWLQTSWHGWQESIQGQGKRKFRQTDVHWGVWGFQGDLEAAGPSAEPPRPSLPKMVTEEYPTRSRSCLILLCLPSHSHQPSVPTRSGLRNQGSSSSTSDRPASLLQKRHRDLPRRNSKVTKTQNLVSPVHRGQKHQASQGRGNRTNRRWKSRRDHRSKHRRSKVRSTRVTRYYHLSTSPIQSTLS